MSLTMNYQVISQVIMNNNNNAGGGQILALAVDYVGGVFFTDGSRIQYYFDDCASYDTQCFKEGEDLLQPNTYTNYEFSALAICDKTQASSAKCGGVSRNLYVSSLIFSSIYVLEVCQDDSGVVNASATMLNEGGGGVSMT